MSDPIVKVQVVGAEQVSLNLRKQAEDVRPRVRQQVQRLGLELLAKVKREYLSGQALKVQTGRLRRSINELTTDDGTLISSAVGTNVKYGRVHELGFTGVEQVREHIRRSKEGRSATVRAHQRHVHLPARSFLRPALAEMRPVVLRALSEGLVP